MNDRAPITKEQFFGSKQSKMFIDQPEEIVKYCKKYWPEDCSHIIQVADRFCKNEFLFDLKQDLERTWIPIVFPKGEIDWSYMPGNDKEFIFQFNRHRYFISLGQAYLLTGDEKYAQTFVELLTHWIKTQKPDETTKDTTWRSLEVGFRGEFWVKAIWYFKDSPSLTDEVLQKFYDCLICHGEYLISAHSPYRYISNWGVIENHGLFEIGMVMLDKEIRERFINTAVGHLEAEARIQIFDDGTHWEQSPSYHNEVLHCYEDILILAERNGIRLPEIITANVRKMAMAELSWEKPNHRQFMTGDSDDTEISDMLAIAACIYKDPVLKYGAGERLDFDSVWDLGIGAALSYEQMEFQKPDFLSMALEDSGNYYLRSKWGADGSLLHFHCGTMGAGHGHSDQLHIDLVINGEDILTDGGRFTYVAGADRYSFKDPSGHNTITVDDRPFTVCKDSWECSKLCSPVKRPFRFKDAYELVQGAHLGYMDEGDGVAVSRRVIYIRPDIYVIADELYTGGTHQYQQYWHFSEAGHASLEQRDGRVSAVFETEATSARLYFLGDGLSAELKKSRIAREYNMAAERDCIQISQKKSGFASFITVIHGAEKNKFTELQVEKIKVSSVLKCITYPDSMAEAVRISGNGSDYVVIICHQEVNSPTDLTEAAGCMGYGNIIVFDRTRECLCGTVLDY